MRAKRAVASISARVRKAHVAATRARTIASLSSAVTVGYRPRPVQQGSAPQIGVVAGEVVPAGNQQQQPLQSVHVATCESAWHAAVHAEASPVFDCDASVVFAASVDPPESGSADPLLPLEELVLPPLLPPLLLVLPPLLLLPLLLVEASVAASPEPDPLSSLSGPEVLLVLLQATSPTVDDAPMTTMTWKSFSMFMNHTVSPDG
jgi:hypothetical protein